MLVFSWFCRFLSVSSVFFSFSCYFSTSFSFYFFPLFFLFFFLLKFVSFRTKQSNSLPPSLQIAHVCDSLLTGLKGVADKTVIGNGSPDVTDGRVIGQVCVITRSNHKQFYETVDAIGRSAHWNANENGPPRPQIFFAGNDKKEMYFQQVKYVDGFCFFLSTGSIDIAVKDTLKCSWILILSSSLQLLDVFYLYSNQPDKIKNPYIQNFVSYDELRKHSEKVEDIEIMGKCMIVQRFHKGVEQHVENIR